MADGARTEELTGVRKAPGRDRGPGRAARAVFEISARGHKANLPGDRRDPGGRRGNHRRVRGAPALDAGLVGAAQAVEHYEITRYGTLKRWAELLGMADAAELLDHNLQEELATDEALSALGEDGVNERALEQAA